MGIKNGNDVGAMLAGIQEKFASGRVFVAIRLKHDQKTEN